MLLHHSRMEVASVTFTWYFSCINESVSVSKRNIIYNIPKLNTVMSLPAEIVTSDAQWCSKQYISYPRGQRSYMFPLLLQKRLNKLAIIGVTCRSKAATIASFFIILWFHLVYRTIVMSQDPQNLPACKSPLFRIIVLMGIKSIYNIFQSFITIDKISESKATNK